jgi:hypothetical protein
MNEHGAIGYSSANSTEDVASLASEREAVYERHLLVRCLRPLCGQDPLIVNRSQLRGPCGLQRYNRGRKKKNEGLEWNVREELVPGFCPKLVARGLGLPSPSGRAASRERSAGRKGPDPDSRRP